MKELSLTNQIGITADENIENGEKTIFLETMHEKFLELMKNIFFLFQTLKEGINKNKQIPIYTHCSVTIEFIIMGKNVKPKIQIIKKRQ